MSVSVSVSVSGGRGRAACGRVKRGELREPAVNPRSALELPIVSPATLFIHGEKELSRGPLAAPLFRLAEPVCVQRVARKNPEAGGQSARDRTSQLVEPSPQRPVVAPRRPPSLSSTVRSLIPLRMSALESA